MRLGPAALGLALAVLAGGARAAWAVNGCDAFTAALRANASDLGVEFSRAIVVSRTRVDANVFDITTRVDVDATLSCRGDRLLRFEARISEPANARTNTNFERFQTAALKAALGWDANKSRGVVKGMTADAREFLGASRQRGDVFVAGKTEEHEPGGVSLGLMATDTDRTFVIVGPAGQ
jgi:phytoene dehydrogenase-like protein